jgi:hypothetical protein
MKLLHPRARRCEPYSDGPWFFAYDARHVERLRALGAYQALLGQASGAAGERRLEETAREGLALACETAQDRICVDVLAGKKLGAARKAKAAWLSPQRGWLSVPSGRLRIESLNNVSFGPDEPESEGCEVEVPAGDYDVVVHRVDWELIEVESHGERPELPTVFMELLPVGRKVPWRRRRASRLPRPWATRGSGSAPAGWRTGSSTAPRGRTNTTAPSST